MENRNNIYEEIIKLNTNFLITINNSEHQEFPNITENYLSELKEILGFDYIVILQPLLLTSMLENLCCTKSVDEKKSLFKLISGVNVKKRTDILNSIEKNVEYCSTTKKTFPLFNELIYKQVITYPIINTYKFNTINGGIFFLNKTVKFDLTDEMAEIITIVSESITVAYNSCRKNQLFNSHYSILQNTNISSNNAICIYSYDGFVVFVNNPFLSLIGKSESEVLGYKILDIINLKNHNELKDFNSVSDVPNPKIIVDREAMYVELIKPNEENTILRKYYKPISLEEKWYRMIILEDMSKELENIDTIELSSFIDSLTGLKNRNYFQKNIDNIFLREKLPVATIVGDINGLKLMNDIFGHDYGDLMLKKIAEVLLDNCKDGEVYRVGGDEFYIFLNNTSEEAIERTIKKINSDCKKMFEKLNFIGISLGYEITNNEKEKIETSIRKAETEMYYTKSLSSEAIKKESIESLKKMYLEKYTKEHERVSRMISIAKGFSPYLSLRESETRDVCNALELIDIGKVSIEHFLTNTNLINLDDEFENMKKHCRIGYKIASLSYETSHLARLILNHHENWDGSGFPQGVKEKAIPFLTRIIRIIEYYDNLTSNNANFECEQIVNEIDSKKGKLFDPTITSAFIKYILEQKK